MSAVTIFGDGSLGLRPLALRGAETIEPPNIDIGADVLDIERKAAEPARITICRQSPQDAGYREVFVSLDGKQLVMLEFGETYTCEVKAGPHRLRAHNTLFWKTHHLVLRPGEHAKFIAINRTGTISFGLLFMLGAFPIYLTFERESETLNSQLPTPNSQVPSQE